MKSLLHKSMLLSSALIVSACGQASSNSSTGSDDAKASNDVAAVKDFHLTKDIGGGWLVTGLKAKDGNVVGDILMSTDEQSCGFKDDSNTSRETAISIACPTTQDNVWSIISPSRDIILNVSCRGETYYQHSCRAAHRDSAPGSDTASETSAIEQQAAAGDALAQSRMGVMYAEGEGGKTLDYKKAVSLYEQSARQGFANGQVNLAGMYEDGQGVPKDNVLALAWFTVAANGTAENYISQLEPLMKPKQIKEAKKLASQWKKGDLIKH